MIARYESRIRSIGGAYRWRGAGGAYYYARREYNRLRDRFVSLVNISSMEAFDIVEDAIKMHTHMIAFASRD